jgi:two-component system KDP operon response regulator KdpE
MSEFAGIALLVEDEPHIRRFVRGALEQEGWQVHEAATLQRGLTEAGTRKPDVVILDLGLPDGDGVDFIADLRKWSAVPVIVLSARVNEDEKIRALDNGADDYLTKPFGLAELRARVGALLRRAGGPAADPGGRIVLGPVVIDVARRSVQVGSNPVELTPREYELLKTMFSAPGRLLTRGRLLRAVWGAAYGAEAHYLHVYVSRIRRKLDAADPTGTASGLIVAEPGVGYRIAEGDESAS